MLQDTAIKDMQVSSGGETASNRRQHYIAGEKQETTNVQYAQTREGRHQ